MKRFVVHFALYILTFVICLSVSACRPTVDPYNILAGYIADHITTKAEVNATDTIVVWSMGDSICVWDRGERTAETYVLSSGGQTTGVFKGGDLWSPYVALYPYQADAFYDRGVHYTLPTTQQAVEHGFDPHALIMLGAIQQGDITFHAEVGWLRILTPADTRDLRAIRLSSNNPDLNMSTACNYVEIVDTCDFAPNSSYYIAAFPGTYDQGLSLRLTYADSTYRESHSSTPITLTRAQVQTIGLNRK